MNNLLIEFNEEDLQSILAILEKEKDKTKDKEDACEIQEIITNIRCQVKYRNIGK